MKKLSLLFAALLTATVMNLSAATAGKAPDMHDFLYFTSLKADGTGTVQMNKKSMPKDVGWLTATFEYSKDRTNWTDYTFSPYTSSTYTYPGEPIALNQGDTIFFRAKGKNATVNYGAIVYFNFAFGTNDSIAAGGNTMSLYDATCTQDTMTAYGFTSLFNGAKQLMSAPQLPATKLKEGCYRSMFLGCTALTQAPELTATTLADVCYGTMFKNCSALEVSTFSQSCDGAELVVPNVSAPTDWNKNMFAGCQGDAALTAETGIQLGGHYCIKEYKEPDMHDMLYFTSLKADGTGTVQLNKKASIETVADLTATFEYSKDRKNWTEYTWGDWISSVATGAAIALNQGDTVFFRAKGENGKNATMGYSFNAYFRFAFGADDSIAAGGNTMSLYDAKCEQDTMTAGGFYNLFSTNPSLVSVSELKLPAKKLAEDCYYTMFEKCTSLTTAPELPATTLPSYCYNGMFKDCSALTQAPELNATTLAYQCCYQMFQNCTALTVAPALPATKIAERCYACMFEGCTSLTAAPELKADSLANLCYYKMFSGCTSLQVDTCADGSCDGAKLEPTHSGTGEPTSWSKKMFDGCHGAYTNIKLNGHYCIKEYVEPVCQIGTKGYASIADAIAAVKTGDTIQVIKDIQLDAVIVVSFSTPTFTLDLNGHILDGSALTGNYAALIRNVGTLSIIDSDPTATHEAPFDTIQGAIMTGGKGMLLFSTITGGGAINNNYGALTVTGVTFVNNTAYYGGVVFAQYGTAAFTNCRFYGDSSKPSCMGSAIYLQGCQCTIDSCIIKGYSAQHGAIYDSSKASLTIAHTTITGNSAVSGGSIGGIYVSDASLTLNDGTVITNNTDSYTAPFAGIYVWAAANKTNPITLSGKVIIKDNTSNGQPANLCISGKTACDTVALNGLSEGSEIHVCTMINDAVAPATFAANATEADLQYLKSDNGYAFVLKEGMIASKQAYGRKVTSGNFGTICLDKQFIAMEGVEGLYVPYMVKDDSLYCEEVELKDVKAGYAYIFRSNADSVTFALDGNATMAATEANYMKGWLANDYTLVDTDVQAGGTFYGYYFLANNEITKPLAESQMLKNRAMIQLPGAAPSAPARGRLVAFGLNDVNITTGVVDVNANVNANRKMMVNGQLVIIRDGKMFNAQGQEL